MSGAVDQTELMKVFVSYSRDDVAFADQLSVALEDRGFEPILDRHNIDAAENWRERLGALVLSCDAVAFVLTDNSANSPVCAWEVEEARRLGKRILPVVPGEVKASAPQALADLNWIYFYATNDVPGSGMFDGLRKLERALRVDLAWLREQTRLSERAAEWQASWVEDRLLRGAALKEAQDWLGRVPKDASVPVSVREYLTASADAEHGREVAAKAQLAEREQAVRAAEAAVKDRAAAVKRLRWVSISALVAGVLLFAAAMTGGWFAAQNSVASSEAHSALIAREANSLLDDGFHAKAMLMALQGDPAAQAGWPERLLRPEGYGAARSALVRGMTSNRLARVFEAGDLVTTVAFDSSGERFLSGHKDGKARLWRIGEDSPIATFDAESFVWPLAFHPDGERFLTGSEDGKARLWRIGETKPLATVDAGGGFVFAVKFHPDGERFLTGTDLGYVRLWRIGEDMPLATFEGPRNPIFFHPDGERFFVADGKELQLRRFGQNDILARIDGAAGPPAFHPDGERLLVPGEGGELTLWRIGDKQPLEELKVEGGQIVSATFLADGERFLTSSEDGKIRLWKLGEKLRSRSSTAAAA